MKVKVILEATAQDKISEFVLGDKNSSTLEKVIRAADRASDAYMVGSLAATAATAGMGSVSLLPGIATKIGIKALKKAVLKKATEKGATEAVEKGIKKEFGTEISKKAEEQIIKSSSYTSKLKNLKDMILKAVFNYSGNEDVKPEDDTNYIRGMAGVAGNITYVGGLEGAVCASIDNVYIGNNPATLITWVIALGNSTRTITVIKRGDSITVPNNDDNNAKAVYNKTEIPLYKLAILLTNIYKPYDNNIEGKTIPVSDIGKYLIGMDREWLASVEDFK